MVTLTPFLEAIEKRAVDIFNHRFLDHIILFTHLHCKLLYIIYHNILLYRNFRSEKNINKIKYASDIEHHH